MPALRDLQRGMSRALLDGGDPAFEACIVDDTIAAADRLSIYRNTFTGVVVGALRITYPVVEKLVGAEFFAAAAQLFLSQEAPRGAYLNDYGAGFSRFLAGFPPAAGLPYLPDVAALEWAVSCAALAEDAPALDAAALARHAPEDLERLSLAPHPSLRIVALRSPADAIWRAIAEDHEDALGSIRLEVEPFAVAVHRRATGVVLRRLTAPEQAFTEALMQGDPLGAALAAAGDIDGTALLAEHLASGRFTAAG